MKKFSFILAILFALVFIGCGGGGGGSSGTNTYSIDDSSNNALMGPLKNATVNVYKLTDLNISVETTQTNDLGSFSLSLSGIADTEMLIISVSGGKDIDANDDGTLDDIPTVNNGTIRGIAQASDLKNGKVNITLLSEILYKYVEHLIGNVHQDDLEQAMNVVSTKLFKNGINRDTISYRDINDFIPIKQESRDKLDFNYSDLIGSDSLASAIYTDSNATQIETILSNNFKDKLLFNDSGLILEKKYFKINLVEPFKSSVTTSGSSIFINRENNTSKLFDFILKDSNVSFVITNNEDVEIVRWDGCDEVSSDLSICYVNNIREDKFIMPTVSYKQTVYSDNVKDLTEFYTTILDDNVTYTISLDINTSVEKRNFIESVIADDIIINMSDSQRYFRKVISLNKIDDYNYNIITTDVSFLKIYKQGGISLHRELTHADLAEDITKINRSLRNNYGNVRLSPPTKQNDNIFVLEFGKISSQNKTINRAFEVEEAESFQITNNVNLEGKITFKIDADFTFNTSWHYLVPTLENMRFVVKNDVKSELKLIASTELADFSGEKQIGTPLTFKIPLGTSPLWLNASLTFYIGASGKIEGIITVGGEAGINTKVGFNYVNGHTSLIGGFSHSGKFLGTGEVKFSTGAYLKSLPALTVLSVAGMGIDNRLGIYAESSVVDGSSTDGSECDLWKGKAYVKFSKSPVFTWDPWLRDLSWAKKIEKDVNDQYSRESSVSWILKEWSNPCTEVPSYLDITGEDIEESVVSNEGIDKSYTYTLKNTGDTSLNWKVEKSGSITNIINISPTSGTLAKGESIEVLVVLQNSDMSQYQGTKETSYLKFINDSQDERSILEKGGNTFNVVINTEAVLGAPTLESATLTGESIKKVNFKWSLSNTDVDVDVDGFKLYKSNCTDNFSIFKLINDGSKRSLILNYDNISSFLIAGESYCFQMTSYKNDIESAPSNSIQLNIPSYATLISNIKDIDNNPLPSATVRLTVLATSQNISGTGDYIFDKLMPGRYLITVEAEGYSPTTVEVELTDGQTLVYEGQFMLDEELEGITGTVMGKVRDATNNSVGISDVTIEVRKGGGNTNGDVVKTLISDSSGDYSVNDLVSGTYTFTWSKTGYITDSMNVVVVGRETRTNDFSISEILSLGTLRATLRWGADPQDLDSHLIKTTNSSQDYHIYYSNKVAGNDRLDTDDIDGNGPETITINSVNAESSYTYYVYHYAGEGSIATSGARVTVQTSSGSHTYYAPNQSGTYWKVFDIIDGVVTPCTSGCMGTTTPSTRSLRSNTVNENAYLFENLPPKE